MNVNFNLNNTHSNYQQSFQGIKANNFEIKQILNVLSAKETDRFYKLCKAQEVNELTDVALFRTWNDKLSANVFTSPEKANCENYFCESYFQRKDETSIKFIKRMCKKAITIAEKIKNLV